MRIIFYIAIFGFLTSFQMEKEVAFKIAGEPTCLVKGKDYVIKAKVLNPEKNEYVFLEGRGLVITKLDAKDAYNIKVPFSSQSASINIGVRNSKTKKIKQVQSIDFTFCE